MNSTPFLDYGKIRLLNVPHAATLAEESIVQDCYQIKELKGQWAVADIGACYGEFAFFAQSLGHIVHAYEPSPDSVQVILLNETSTTSLAGCFDEIVGSNNGDSTHWYRPHHPAGSGPDCGDGIPSLCKTVSMTLVIERLKRFKLPIFVKMDCEGAEVEIFKHIDEWIEGVQAISMETHHNDADVFGKMLEDHGFNVKLSGTCPYPLPPWTKGMIGGLVIARKP